MSFFNVSYISSFFFSPALAVEENSASTPKSASMQELNGTADDSSLPAPLQPYASRSSQSSGQASIVLSGSAIAAAGRAPNYASYADVVRRGLMQPAAAIENPRSGPALDERDVAVLESASNASCDVLHNPLTRSPPIWDLSASFPGSARKENDASTTANGGEIVKMDELDKGYIVL